VTADPTRPGRLASLAASWLRLNLEQRVAAVAAGLLIVSTLGPFSFVELAEILAAGAVLALLKQRADGRAFHLPFGDGTAIAAAGIWCGVLIGTRIFDRPPGMTALALVCAVLLTLAGLRERAKRAPDDLPGIVAGEPPPRAAPAAPVAAPAPAKRRPKPKPPADDSTRQLTLDEDVTTALPERPAAPEPPA
jgi:hypothetical protein